MDVRGESDEWKAVVWSSNENDNSLDAIGLCKCDWFLSRLSRKHKNPYNEIIVLFYFAAYETIIFWS